MTPTGELQRALQKSAHLSSKKRNKKINKQKSKEYTIKRLYPGDVISYYPFYGPDFENEIKYGIVVSVSSGKKKWIRRYKILTEHVLWEPYHADLEKSYRIEKVN